MLFLRANFTNNSTWECKTFHHDENSSELYSGGFSKSFVLELTTFPGFFKPNYPILNYKVHYTHNTMLKYDITQKEGEVGVIENATMP